MRGEKMDHTLDASGGRRILQKKRSLLNKKRKER